MDDLEYTVTEIPGFLQILLRKAASVLDERAKQDGDVMVFSAEEGKALLALAQRGIRAMQAEQEQR
jgi:pimeloyl-CoA synthetase